MNFCLTPKFYDKKEIKSNKENFESKIKLFFLNKKFFELKNQSKFNKNNNLSSDIPNIKSKSTWKLPKNYHTINTFVETRNNDIDELLK